MSLRGAFAPTVILTWLGGAKAPRKLKLAPRLLCLLLALATTSAFADMLDYVTPRGGSIGTSVEVLLHGASLENPKEILFYNDCIRATDVASGVKPSSEARARFIIARNCSPGEHVLRLRTATALSEPITFWVSPFPAIKEGETKQGVNDTPEKAQLVPLNSTVEGEIQAGADPDVDVYRVEMRSGTRLSVEVEGMRLGTSVLGGENDLMLRIIGPNGKLLAESKDTGLLLQDPVASIVTPETGPYFIEIKQQIYTPPRLAYYRVHIGSFIRPLALFPAGGERGSEMRIRVLGDPQGERVETLKVPLQLGDLGYFAGEQRSEAPPSPNRFRVSPYPNVIAEGPEPTPVSVLPIALNGILDQNKKQAFRFSAKKSDPWRIQVFGRSLGSPMDPRIVIHPVNSDKPVLQADDAKLSDLGLPSARGSWAIPASLDPLVLFKPPADGEYILEIEDSQQRTGPLFVYRIEIETVRETILTHISANDGVPLPRLLGVAVPKGSRWTVDVQIAPGLGSQYKGDLVLEAKGLPRGVEMFAPAVPKGQNRLPVMFYASEEAEEKIKFFELFVHSADGKTPIESHSHQSFATINRGVERPLHMTFLNRYAMAVTQPAPFQVELETPKVPLPQNGELALKVRVVRKEGFKDPLEISADWLPPNVSKGGVVTIPADKTEADYTIRAGGNAAPGSYKINLNVATTNGERFTGAGRIRVSTTVVPVTIAAPYMKISMRRSSVEQGRKGEITASVEPAKTFTGEAVLSLKNLPKGVKLLEPKPKVTPLTREIVFVLQADADALAGLYKDITCDLAVTTDGQTVHQQTGSGVIRVDPVRIVAAVAK